MRRAVALGLVLFAAYATTMGLRAFDGGRHAGAAPHYLLAAKSIVDDHDVDLTDQYAARSYESFYPRRLAPRGVERDGALFERYGTGFPLLIAPAYAVGGQTGVQLMLAVLAALATTLAYRLALRVVPDPWALGATAAVGLSPPLLASSTTVAPDVTAGLLLGAAALLAVRLDEHVSRRGAFGCFALLGLLPWLGLQFVPVGVVVGAFAARSIARARRRTLALGATEVAFFSAALYVGINEAFYDSPWPYAGVSDAFGSDDAGTLVARATRIVALFVDREVGLVRWAPLFALGLVGAWVLWRGRRDRLARAMPQLRAPERTATLCALAAAVQVLVVAFLAPSIDGGAFPPVGLIAALPLAAPLVAMGLRRLPRIGAVLIALSLVASVWLSLTVRFGSAGLVEGRPEAPFGPLVRLLPTFGDDGAADHLIAVAVVAALAAAALAASRLSAIARAS